ncbi:hypothetical protein Taro_010304, partial [Colocasia esculenta]|nr:hypothetical protein [Colocasia esculenta]
RDIYDKKGPLFMSQSHQSAHPSQPPTLLSWVGNGECSRRWVKEKRPSAVLELFSFPASSWVQVGADAQSMSQWLSFLRSSVASLQQAQQVHAQIVVLGQHHYSQNHLLSKLVDLRCLEYALTVFRDIPFHDGFSYTSMIRAYATGGHPRQSLLFYWELLDSGSRPSNLTYPFVFKACSALSAVCVGRQVHGHVFKLGFGADVFVGNSLVDMYSKCFQPEAAQRVGRWVSTFISVNAMPLDVMLSTALIDMHSKCGELDKARRHFDEAPEKNLASWNAMLTGYVQGGFPEAAVQLFSDMRFTSLSPNQITLVNLLSAFASMGALELGTEAHIQSARSGMEINVFLATALVNMYSRCGAIGYACLVFTKTSDKDLGLWNAMLTGLAAHGHGKDVLTIFSQVERTGMRPNEITFIGVLSACSHSGLVEAGRENFRKMSEVYGLDAQLEHYSCMVDLLGRAGHLDEALALVHSMERPPDWVIWGSLLNACRIHNDIKLANEIGSIIFSSKVPNLGCAVMLANIFAGAGMWADVARIRRLIKEAGVRKPSGCSWIEIEGIVHRFLVEDTIHEKSYEVYKMLTRLMEEVSMEGTEHDLEFFITDIHVL